MSQTSAIIQALGNRVQKLIAKFEQQQQENLKLAEKVKSMEEKREQQEAHVQQLEMQNLVLKSSLKELDEKDKKEILKKLNQYIRNVDDCIAYLSK